MTDYGNKEFEKINLDHEYRIRALESHERHMEHIYSARRRGMWLAALALVMGAVMTFLGLEGSFNWAFEKADTISAKLTNASPGIVFATVGLILGLISILKGPVNYNIGSDVLDSQSMRLGSNDDNFSGRSSYLGIDPPSWKK